jgi:hypothetical protein
VLEDDLAKGFAGKFYLEDALNLTDEGGAVIVAAFISQFAPAPDGVLINGWSALLVDATAEQDAGEVLGIARDDGICP